MDGWMDGWMDGRMDGRMDGWIDRRFSSDYFKWLYSLCGAWPLFTFLIISQTVGLPGRVISSSQDLYLNTGQHKHRINAHTPKIHALSGILTHDHSVRASEDGSYLTPLDYRDRLFSLLPGNNLLYLIDPGSYVSISVS
jgi:hypothetical protein